jgi:hypothetical protein
MQHVRELLSSSCSFLCSVPVSVPVYNSVEGLQECVMCGVSEHTDMLERKSLLIDSRNRETKADVWRFPFWLSTVLYYVGNGR